MTEEEEEGVPHIRQVGLVGLNESVMLSSSDPKESMQVLSKMAVSLYNQIKRSNGKI